MPYLNETGLARYDGLLKPWIANQPHKTVPDSLYPYATSAKAGAVGIYPVGETELKPSVDFLFTETGPAEGTKAPDNPSTITGVSSVNVGRCGTNLIPPAAAGTQTKNGVDFVTAADGTITATGTGGTGNSSLYIAVKTVPIIQGHTYAMSGCPSGGSSSTYMITSTLYQPDGTVVVYGPLTDYGSGSTYTAAASGWLTVSVRVYAGVTVSGLVFRPQVEDAATATAYQAPVRDTYTISLGSTYYGGSIDLATGLMTVTWEGIVYDGTENITKLTDLDESTPQYNLPVSSYRLNGLDLQTGSHFPFGYTANCGYVRTSGGYGYRVYPVGYDTLESFVAWVAAQYANGTPVTLCYRTATPTTVQLTPTQILSLTQTDKYTPRCNTVYSDQTSVQVGYVKSPIREEYELTQAIVAQGGNI